jgi:preprotein translocase subunit YajC
VFISNAYAQAAEPVATSSLLGSIWPLLIMFPVMYFLMIRPQQKRAKEQRDLMDGLAKGDEVVTAGGILGKVTKINDTYITIEIAANTEIVIQKNSITTLLPKGTLKSL